MSKLKHEWGTFHKGRMRVRACVSCGELHLPSNTEKVCENHTVLESQIVKAGYKMYASHA